MARPNRTKILLIALTLILACSAHAIAQADQFTPVVVAPLTHDTQPVLGTDGRQHVVYELLLTNANATPATLQKIEVIDAANPSTVLASFADSKLLAILRTTGSTAAENLTIEFNGTRLLLLDLDFPAETTLPTHLLHRIDLLGGASPSRKPATPMPLSYTAALFDLHQGLPVIGPPLLGDHWIALNGCCGLAGVHRSSGISVNGRICFSQRFAIDWMRLNKGRIVNGDLHNVHNYAAYGADVIAVADGTVVEILNTLEDQKPGVLPDPSTINIQNVDGNHIVLKLGEGLFAFYAHLEKNSITVAPGDHVKRGQLLAKLGNTGNTSGPHLHFHLMDGPSVLGSSGLPYVIDSFVTTGELNAAKFAAADGVEGDWSEGTNASPSPRQKQMPLNLVVVDFPNQKP
jgi:murein DD-endopeptidase MepM/ murein hydrolase activator NlpD